MFPHVVRLAANPAYCPREYSPAPTMIRPHDAERGSTMKIVITGGLGKIGQWVVNELIDNAEQGPHQVLVIDRAPGPQQGPFQQGPVRYLIADVADLGQVQGALVGADAVIYLAAYPAPSYVPDDVTFR